MKIIARNSILIAFRLPMYTMYMYIYIYVYAYIYVFVSVSIYRCTRIFIISIKQRFLITSTENGVVLPINLTI